MMSLAQNVKQKKSLETVCVLWKNISARKFYRQTERPVHFPNEQQGLSRDFLGSRASAQVVRL